MWWCPGQRARKVGSIVDTPHSRPDLRELEKQLLLGAECTLPMLQGYHRGPGLVWQWVESRDKNDRHPEWPEWPLCYTVPMIWRDQAAQAMFKLSAEWEAIQLYSIDRTLRSV